MRMVWLAGSILAAVVAWPQGAFAGALEIDKDERSVKKYAAERIGTSTWDAKARGLCVCLNDAVPEYENKLGLIFFEREIVDIDGEDRDMITVQCRAFSYDRTTGERTSFVICDSWIPLAK